MKSSSMPYNYKRFKAAYYDLENFGGPKPSQPMIDFSLCDLNNNRVNLSDFHDKWIVIESGSITCPQYISHIKKMNQLKEENPDVVFLVLYVREAHPGNKIKTPTTIEEKVKLANHAKQTYGEKRIVVTDDVEGHVHQKIGSRPNCIYVLDPRHHVYFRSDWNVTEQLENVLAEKDKLPYYPNDHYEPKLAHPFLALKIIFNAGFLALFDLVLALPKLIYMHYQSKKIEKYE